MSREITLSPRLRPWLIALGLIVITLTIFSEAPREGFLAWDDNVNIYDNPYLNPVTLPNVLHFWGHAYYSLYMPLTYTVWSGLAKVATLPEPLPTPTFSYSNLDPAPFHALNLLLHVLNVVLVFLLLRDLLGDDAGAGIGALLFAIHPLQVEPVTWITGLNNLLAGFFSLLAIRLYLQGALASRDGRSGARKLWSWALFAFLLALLAKPMAVTTPVIAWILDRWMIGRSSRDCTRSLAPWAALSVLCVGAAQLAQGPGNSGAGIPLWGRPFIAGNALAFYLEKLIVPLGLCVDYGRTPAMLLRNPSTYFTWLIPAALGYMAWRGRERYPQLVAAAGVFVAGVLPALGFVPFYLHRYSTVGDRYLYISMVGAALALGWAFSRARLPITRVACVVVLALYAFGAALQTLYWSSNLTLFRHTIEVNPNSWTAHNNLGNVLRNQGKYSQAESEYRASIAVKPDFEDVRVNYAILLALEGHVELAFAQYRKALELVPNDATAHYNLGVLLARQGRLAEAIRQFEIGLSQSPNYTKARYDLALALLRQGHRQQAVEQLHQALAGNPDFTPAERELQEQGQGTAGTSVGVPGAR